MTNYLLPALFSFLFTFLLVRVALRVFPKWGLMDRPLQYGLNRPKIPYYGGITIVSGFFVSTLIFVPIDKHMIGLMLGALIITLVSFWDDLKGLSPYFRLLIQFVAAFILVLFGVGISTISNPIGVPVNLDQLIFSLDGIYTISVFSALFTIIWVVTLMNTMNWLDGLNGLPSGVAVIASLVLFLLSIRPGIHFDMSSQVPVAMMSIILFGCVLAFWCHDFYPAKILMGDTGSMTIGFVLASLSIFSGGKVATAFLVLGFPILDALWVILRRIMSGKSPFRGDLKHFHHRLLEIGFSQRKALLLIYGLCAIFGGIAVFLEGKQKLYAILTMFILMAIMGIIAVVVSAKKRYK